MHENAYLKCNFANFCWSMLPDHPTMVLPTALSIILICGVTVRRNFRPPMEAFCVCHWVQILVLFENSLSFKILCFSLALCSQHSAPKVITKIENLGFKSWLSVYNVGWINGHCLFRNLFRKWPVCWWWQRSTRSMCRSNLRAKKFVNMINFARESWKVLE